MFHRMEKSIPALALCAAFAISGSAQVLRFIQQGPKLVGSGAVGQADQGWSVAVSGDGNTAIVGGLTDNSNQGAAWVYTRTNGTWTQQTKLVATTGAIGSTVELGSSVALSSDGNTALVGAQGDNNFVGAAWVFVRSGGVWTQQTKLIANDSVGKAEVGYSVALSGDGNTALIGGRFDKSPDGLTSKDGAAWVFVRVGSAWTQQGPKLVGTGAIGHATQGQSVALSADGNTALVGGPADNFDGFAAVGAAWVFARSGTVWTQQGPKLIGTGGAGSNGTQQGSGVALSGDGNTALVGGNADNGFTGATWVFVRSGVTWTQQGSKLVGSGANGTSAQGAAVALSSDGNTALIGGPGDNSTLGAAWVFKRVLGNWTQFHTKLVGSGADPGTQHEVTQGSAVALSSDGNTALSGAAFDANSTGAAWVFVVSSITPGDFNGNGVPDLVWQNDSTRQVAVWYMGGTNGAQFQSFGWLDQDGVPGWSVATVTDLNRDGIPDLIWQNDTTGQVVVFYMGGPSGATTVSFAWISIQNLPQWKVVGAADLNADGVPDLIFQNTSTGQVGAWLMGGAQGSQFQAYLGLAQAPAGWNVVGMADLDGDGHPDLVFQNASTGQVVAWYMGGAQGNVVVNYTWLQINTNTATWKVVGLVDLDGNGSPDLIWQENTSREVVAWYMGGTLGNIAESFATLQSTPLPGWRALMAH